jgi:hypothetical protein
MLHGESIELENTVTKEIEFVDKHDILKIEADDNRGVIFITKNNTYRFPNSAEFWSEILYRDGFRLLDRTNVVNMYQVSELDDIRGIVKFYDDDKLSGSVTRIHSTYVKFVLSRLKIGQPSLLEADAEFANKGGYEFKKLISSIVKKLNRIGSTTSKDSKITEGI